MKTIELIEKINNGEDSYTQFKQMPIRTQSLAKEMVAFSNSEGGIIIFGVADNKEIKGLNSETIEKLGQLVANVANENIRPPIYPLTQIKTINDLKLMIVTIHKGISKPYATTQPELKRLFAQSNNLYADEEIVFNTNITNLNKELFYEFLEKEDLRIYEELQNEQLTSSLRKVQVETNFNSLGKLEINEIILSELIVNALVHRDYYIVYQ